MPRVVPLIALLVLCVAGCVSDPYDERRAREAAAPEPSATPAQVDVAPEPEPTELQLPPAAPPGDPSGLAASPRAAIATYVRLVGNWDSRTAKQQYQDVLGLTAGVAREEVEAMLSEMNVNELEARQLREESVLEKAVPHEPDANGDPRWLVVVRQTISTGDAPSGEHWQVALVTLHRYSGRWAVVRWVTKP